MKLDAKNVITTRNFILVFLFFWARDITLCLFFKVQTTKSRISIGESQKTHLLFIFNQETIGCQNYNTSQPNESETQEGITSNGTTSTNT